MAVDPKELAKWRKAHQHPDGHYIDVPEAGLATVAPFPSLYASDFAVFLESSGAAAQIVDFVRSISREMDWVYGGWAKAQHDGQPAKLLEAMLNDCSGGDAYYEPIKKFLTDYAKAHGISLRGDAAASPAWRGALGDQTVVEAPPV